MGTPLPPAIGPEIGYDVPARPGMDVSAVQTPCLILDLGALERNITRMGDFARSHGIAHRSHGKMHKSVDVQRLQQNLGGAVGVCCQKVSEAEAFVRGGIADVLISNQVRDPAKIDRLARLPLRGAVVSVCIDDIANVAELAAATERHGTTLGALVEYDCGAGRCGVTTPAAAVAIARAIAATPGLRYAGLQAYQGALQHIEDYDQRRAAAETALARTRAVIDALAAAGLAPPTVTGGGTGSYVFETTSGLYTEIQCGSYAFMDADYGRITGRDGARLDAGDWENALFVLTSVMSHARPDTAICDAGLKALATDSGLPLVRGHADIVYAGCSDEHGTLHDPHGILRINDRLRLIPGHCDPTCNLHDWYVGLRGDTVETIWPVSARGKGY